MEKAVAFLDLLGFSKLVEQSLADAVTVISSFNTIVEELHFEKRVHPSSNYSSELQDLARRTSIESVDDFLPFSDSVFITSSNCDDFVLQLGSFVRKCFMFTANHYLRPIDPQDPTKVSIPNISVGKDGHLIEPRTESHIPPVLFRGGLSFGEVENLNPTGLVKGQGIRMNTLAGIGVVQAVRLESSENIKGPRLVLDDKLYNKLCAQTKQYCRPLPERPDYYEVLWPMMGYINTNRYTTEFSNFHELFIPVRNLWVPYKQKPEIGIQYIKFMEIIIVSAIKTYDIFWGKKDYAINLIKKILEEQKVLEPFDYLLLLKTPPG